VAAVVIAAGLAGGVRAADKPADDEIARLMVGTWVSAGDASSGAVGTLHYRADGTLTGTGVVRVGEEAVEVRVEGTWKVSGGAVLLTLTKSSHPGLAPIGAEAKEVILAIDADSVRYRRGVGKEKTRTRVKE
jgi:hypothetical protein